MKLLYYASYIFTAPFWALGWLFYGLSLLFDWIGGFVHDQTTYRIWLVLHNRALNPVKSQDGKCPKCGRNHDWLKL